jgi:protein-tyrosine phosphatase
MVCLGNICRSPLAEGIMKEKFKNYGLEGKVDSAGTASYHIGEPPDPRSIDIASKYGIDISGQVARAFNVSDFDHFDYIFAMDQENFSNIIRKARSDKDKRKVNLILDNLFPDEEKEVPDPYYGGKEGFEKVFRLLDDGCEAILGKLKN